jgi:hypothetical protein
MQMKPVLKKALIYARNIVLADLGISLVVPVSFIFGGKLSFLSYSERLFWAGLGVTLIGGVVGFSASFAGRNFGIPTLIRRPEEAKRFMTHFVEYREEVEKRYDQGIQFFFVGLGCIGISALIQAFLA